MITGTLKTTAMPYRQKEGLNFSSIKIFEDKGPMMFYKEFIVGDKKVLDSAAILIGSMVDDIVLTYGGSIDEFHQHFDERYCKMEGTKSSAQAFTLADYIFDAMMEVELGQKAVDDDGKIFEVCFNEAFAKIQAEGKYKGKTPEQALQDFEKTARGYFDNKIANIGKMIVDLNMITTAENVAQQLLTDSFTSSLLKNENNPLLTKVQIDFQMDDVKCKAELDAIEIDHRNKTIGAIDLKCTYDNEEFPYAYVKNRYYLQQAFYTQALLQWRIDNGLHDYDIVPFRFIVADTSANKRRPLIYTLTPDDIFKGLDGFVLRGYQYRGVIEIVRDIRWHMEMDVWNCSKEAVDLNGNLTLSINYDN